MFLHIFDCEKDRFLTDNIALLNEKLISSSTEISISRNIYYESLIGEELDVMVRIFRKEWIQLQNIILYDLTISYKCAVASREIINNAFSSILNYLRIYINVNKHKVETVLKVLLETFLTVVIPISAFTSEKLNKLTSLDNNNTNNPTYQYFHTYFEVKYYLLCIQYVCESNFQLHCEQIMQDLITLIKHYFHRRQINSSNYQPLNICKCINNFWHILQIFLVNFNKNENAFWKLFNKVIDKDDPLFIFWLIRVVTETEQSITNVEIESNFDLLEESLKTLLTETRPITLHLQIIRPLMCDKWIKSARIEVYQIIWDYFSKRLNSSSKTIYSGKIDINVLDFNRLLDTILNNPGDCDEDFEIFVGMLMIHLRENNFHWGKMKGRIFSQLGPNKIKELYDVGLIHVFVLYISLTTLYREEITKKIMSLMDCLSNEKAQKQLVWNLYMTFLIRLVHSGYSIENVTPPMLRMLETASNDHRHFHLIKGFIDNFEFMINFSENTELHQWLLIDNWLVKYLSICQYTDLTSALNIFLTILDRVGTADEWPNWKHVYENLVYCSLKQISHSMTTPSIIGRLSGKISLLIPSLWNEAFVFFNSDSISASISSEYLNVVLESYPKECILLVQQEQLAIQTWTKVTLLSGNGQLQLTKNVLKLDLFPMELKELLANANDPFITLIEYMGSNVQHQQILKLSDIVFGQVHKHIEQFLSLHSNEEAIVLRIYTCISLAFFHCSILLYNRHSSSSPLTRLISIMLLPTEFLMGKAVPAIILDCVRKTWQIFFESLINLNKFTDMYLERTIRDMVIKYLPYFSTMDSPITRCLDNERLAEIILEKISNSFLKQSCNEIEANVLKAIRIITHCVQSTTSLILLKLIISKTLFGLFEIVMFHSQKNAAISAVNAITSSALYAEVREHFQEVLINLTTKHMAFNTTQYFQLLTILTKFIPADLKCWIILIKKHMVTVERMRGVGFDKNLRLPLEKLEMILK